MGKINCLHRGYNVLSRLPLKIRLVLFTFLLICTGRLTAEAQGAQKMLWYAGRMVNDTTIVTKKGSTVHFSPRKGNIKVSIPKEKDPFDYYRRELEKTSDAKKSSAGVFTRSKNGRKKVPLMDQANRELDRVQSDAAVHLRNTIEIGEPLSGNRPTYASAGASGEVPQEIKNNYAAVMAFVVKKQGEKNFDPPPPPSSEFDYCWECDSSRQKAYREACDQYTKEYIGEHADMIEKAMKVLRYFALKEYYKEPYDKVSAAKMEPDMTKAVTAILDHTKSKLKVLWTKYKEDAHKLQYIVNLVLAICRQDQLMGTEDDTFIPFGEIATTLISVSEKYYVKAIEEKDYRVMLNIRWYVGLVRQAELLGVAHSEALENGLGALTEVGRFKISIDADGKIGQKNIYQLAHIKGDNEFMAFVDTSCRLKWVLADENSKHMVYDLENAEMIMPDPRPVYVGTKSWKSGPADIKLDFCKDDRDTAIFHGFVAGNNQELWNMGPAGTMPMQIVAGVLGASLMDVERIKRDAQKYKDPAVRAAMQKELMDIHKKHVEPHAALMGKDPSAMTPEEIRKVNELLLASADISALTQAPSPFSFLVKGKLQNKNPVVFEHRLDGKKLFPENTAIVYAYFNVKIEHIGKVLKKQ